MAILTTTDQGLNFTGGSSFIKTGTSTLMSFNTSGEVGVGTDNPSRTLHVLGGDGGSGTHIAHFEGRSGVVGMYVRGDGKVGIGTTSPAARLHVQSSGSDGIIVRTSTNVEPFIALQRNTGSNGVAVLRSIDGGDLRIDTGATGAAQSTKMTVEAGGNVGIGTTSPAYKLDVAGAIRTNSRFWASTGTSGETLLMGYWDAANARIESDAALPMLITSYEGNIKLGISGGTTMTVKSTAVGIGTTNPARKLHIQDTTGNPQLVIGDGASIYSSIQSANSLFINAGDGGGGSSTIFRRGTSLTESMRINSSGEVSIGSPSSQGAVLRLYNTNGGNWNDGLIIDDPSGWAATIYKRDNAPKMFTGLYSGDDNYIWMSTGYSNSGTTITAPRGDAVLMARPSTDDLQIYLETHFGQKVGIGTVSPVEKLTVAGGSGAMLGFKRFYSNTGVVPAGVGSSYSLTASLNDEQGTTLTTQFQYKFYLTTTSTGTYNSSVYIVYRNGGDTAWVAHRVSSTGLSSNHPELTVSGNNALIFNDHASAYSVAYRVESTYSGQAKTSPQLFGSDYMWTRDNTELYYMGGSVGIGTDSPSAKLDVTGGNILISDTANDKYFGSNVNLILNADADGNSGDAYRNIIFQNRGSETARIDVSGNVGIGTTSPSELLEVSSNTGGGSGTANPTTIRISDSGQGSAWDTSNSFTNLDFYSADSSGSGAGTKARVGAIAENSTGAKIGLAFSTTNTTDDISEKLRIDATGNVGIGTTTPETKLHVASGDVLISNNQFYTAESTLGTNYKLAGLTSGNIIQVGAIDYTSASTVFAGGDNVSVTTGGASGTSRLYINSSGEVGIGTTSPSSKLDVDGLISSDQIQSKEYTSLTGSSEDWFPIGTVTDGSTGPVYFNVSTIYHSSMSFMVGDGYPASGQGNITLLNSVYNANSGYANITAARLKDDGVVEIKLEWSTGPTVNIKITARSTTGPLALPASLATATSTSTVRDTVTNETGKLRSKNLITTDSNVVLNNSGDSYLNGGNVGIGTTTPSEKLHVQGAVGTTNGTAALPTHTFYSDNDTGMYRAAVNTLAFSTASAERMRINSSGTVGIGTTSPSYKLDVNGTIGGTQLHIQGGYALGSSANFLYIDPNTQFSSGIYINNAVKVDGGLLGSYNEDLQLRTGANTRLTLSSSTGNATFAADVDVNGITTSDAFRTDTSNTDYNVISRNGTSTTLWVQAAQSGSIQGIASFRYGSATVNQGTEVCAIRRNSSYFINTKLGVGTSSPSVTLDVDGPIKHKVYTVSTLPSASPAGQRAFVSDAYYDLASAHGSTFPGGGSYTIPCYSDGSDWRAG